MRNKTLLFVLVCLIILSMSIAQPVSSVRGNTQTTYKSYFPSIMTGTKYFGLAVAVQNQSDISDLRVSWWYNYSTTGNVPMQWNCSNSSNIPSGWGDYILVCNEPDRSDQANVAPSVAATAMYATRINHPNAKLVCCNLSSNGYSWLATFYSFGSTYYPDAWSVHAYVNPPIYTVSYLESQITAMHNLTGGDYWITEYGVLSGDLSQFQELTDWMRSQFWIKRIAPYTNRQPHTGQPWELPSGVELFDYQTGLIKPIGEYYRDLTFLIP